MYVLLSGIDDWSSVRLVVFGIAALLPDGCARFTHNPARGASLAQRLQVDPLQVLHRLRRSFNSLTEWLETPAGVVAQIMGHKPSATAEISE